MWRSRTALLLYGIFGLCFSHYIVTEVGAQELRRIEVNPAAQDIGQLLFHCEKSESRHMLHFELDQDVNVTLGPEVIAQDGAEKRKFFDVMLLAESCYFLVVDFNLLHSHCILMTNYRRNNDPLSIYSHQFAGYSILQAAVISIYCRAVPIPPNLQ